MSEYVPTTERVEESYQRQREYLAGRTDSESHAEFDRWLSTIQPSPDDPAMVERVARVLGKHRLSEPHGGTATESWCDCSCGARPTLAGGPRDYARLLGEQHLARAVLAAIAGGYHA